MFTLTRAKAALVFTALLAMISAGPAALAAPAQGSARPAVGLVALRHTAEGSQTRIILEGTAELPYTIYKPDEKTILVDLPGVDASSLEEGYAIESRGVERVQVERLRTASGQSLARLRVRLSGPVEDRTVVEGKNLVLTLVDTVGAPSRPATQEVASTATMRAETPSPKPVAVSSSAAPARTASVPSSPATVITGVRTEVEDGQFRAYIATDGRAAFKHFVLPNPDRIVVDVTGVRSAVDRNAVDVKEAGVSRIRIGQFRTSDPRIVRIVFDVSKMGPYDVRQAGDQLVLTLGAATPEVARKSAPVEKPAPQPAAPQPVVTRAPIVGDDAPDAVKSTTQPAATQPSATQPAVKSAMPPAAPRSAPVSAPVKPVSDDPAPQNDARRAPTERTSATSQAATQPRTTTRQAMPPAPAVPTATQDGYLSEGFVGRPVNLELKNVDLRDILRFLHNTYGVNFIVDKSVPAAVPIDVSVKGVPWNQALDAVLKAQGLGAVREGQIIRIAAIGALASERQAELKVQQAIFQSLPLVTKIYRLKYASPFNRSTGIGGSAGGGGGIGGGGGGIGGGLGGSAVGLLPIIKNRLSPRGRVEIDNRTNSLIVTDLAQRLDVVEQIIRALDRPEPQVEIEARIVIARRAFLRDLGVSLSAGVLNTERGGFAGFTTLLQSTQNGDNGADTGGLPPSVGNGLIGTPQLNASGTVAVLTTGLIGTAQISAVVAAAERQGQLRTISSPRVTTQNNTRAEIVNGVQIPVQTVNNNTITTTFVDAALKLQITPQIITEDGAVLLNVLAENSSVSATLRTIGGTPGIDSQRATAVVLVPDGGTTVIGGVNIDSENQADERTPGLARIPIFGNLFKRKQTSRDTSEILFFITPRIFRPEYVGLPQESFVRSQDVTIGPGIPAGSEGDTLLTPSSPAAEPALDDAVQ
jgi:type IV pilus assembly protein PilQ